MYIYDYLLNNLVSDMQIKHNLIRTMKIGSISIISKMELITLALKYYGVDGQGNFTSQPEKVVGYMCPYSGKIVGINDIELDHIIPIKYNGGTVIFNCIPVYKKANRDKWDNPDLLNWWKRKSYFDEDKLERLVCYMLDAYDIYDNDLKYNYIDYSFINEDEEEGLYQKELEKEKFNFDSLQLFSREKVTYYQLLESMINSLPNSKQLAYKKRLERLNVFDGIDEIENLTKVLIEVISKRIDNYNLFLLCININKLYKSLITKDYKKEIEERISKLEKILKENNKTFNTYIDSLRDIDEQNIIYYDTLTQEQINNFINSLRLDLDTKINLFIEMASKKENNKTKFSHNILVPADDNIFNTQYGIKYPGYEDLDITTKSFYSFNRNKIKSRLSEEIAQLISKINLDDKDKDRLEMLERAKQAIDDYEFYNTANARKRIDIFLEMISKSKYTGIILNGDNNRVVPDDNSAFSTVKGIKFEGYENFPITTKSFYNTNRDSIISRLNLRISELVSIDKKEPNEIKELEMLERAKQAIDDYEFYNTANVDKRIDKFIEMLSDPSNTGIMLDNRGRVVPDNDSILNSKSSKPFKDYEHLSILNVAYFFENNKDLIKSRIQSCLENIDEISSLNELNTLMLAKKAIDDYEFYNPNDNSKRVDKFIEMLSDPSNTGIMLSKKGVVPDNNSIFQDKCTKLFKDYEHLNILNVGHFYDDNEDVIKYRIDRQINELRNKIKTPAENVRLEMLKRAKQAIVDFDFYRATSRIKRIDKFIEMLSDPSNTATKQGVGGIVPADDSIFNYMTAKPFKNYEHLSILTTKNFYGNNKDDIRSRIKEQLLELSKVTELKLSDIKKLNMLRLAQKAIDDFDFYNPNDNSKRVEKFIEMIGMDKYTGYINGRPAKGNIFKEPNRKNGQIDEEDLIPFEGYEHIDGLYIKDFWRKYSDSKIIPLLFLSDNYSSSRYDKARENVLKFLNYKQRLHKKEEFKTIEDYLENSNKFEKKKLR